MEDVRQEDCPDMESVTSSVSVPDETYGPMQLMTYLAAQEGDLYLFPGISSFPIPPPGPSCPWRMIRN